MIFDWTANSERMLAKGSLTLADPWDRRHRWAQQIAFLRHLRFALGKDEEEARAAWDSLKGGSADLWGADRDEAGRDFAEQWRKAGERGPILPPPDVHVTDREAAYLNSLEAPLPVRRYWLRLLVYIKDRRARGKRPKYSPSVDSWMIADAGLPGRPRNAARTVAKWSLRCGIPFPVAPSKGKGEPAVVYVPAWIGEGEPAASARMGSFAEADALLREKAFECPECGRGFERSPKAKTELCPVCAAKRRRIRNAERMRRLRKAR